MVYNKKKAKAAKRAERLDIPSCYCKNEDDIITLFNAYKVDMIVMAGWMKIVSKKFIDEFPGRIINLHPSLLPKYKGLNAIEQAINAGETETGCSVHWVTEELDSGRVIRQQTVPILPGDNVKTVTRAVQQCEHQLLPQVLNAF